ncbi:MAG: drug/metabolite transporter (DMT)-like permease [Granulosicoccus sp.]|jgi:drug/metabolite transporter (DMT)-like permease
MNGAGGNSGGIGHFFIGIIMMCGGFYMLLNAITVSSQFGLGSRLYGFSAFGSNLGITGGMVIIPFIFGIGLIFYNSKNILGWLLSVGSVTALIFGVISTVRFNLKTMSSFELIVILVLAVGGLGLFLRSLKAIDGKYS